MLRRLPQPLRDVAFLTKGSDGGVALRHGLARGDGHAVALELQHPTRERYRVDALGAGVVAVAGADFALDAALFGLRVVGGGDGSLEVPGAGHAALRSPKTAIHASTLQNVSTRERCQKTDGRAGAMTWMRAPPAAAAPNSM
jgi:hypothetical protein